MTSSSPNFAYLAAADPLLHRYASLAERYFAEDPNGSLVKMRQFAEALTHASAACLGIATSPADDFLDLLRELDRRLPDRVTELLHDLRKLGNRAVHAHADDHRDALTALKVGHQVAGWYHAAFRARGFRPAAFVIPPDPRHATVALQAQLDALRQEAAEAAAKAAAAEGAKADVARLMAEAEARANRAYADLDAALELASEAERRESALRARFEEEVAAVRATTAAAAPEVGPVASSAEVAASALDVDELTTRKLIDEQLRAAGWDADTLELRWSKGARPEKGRNLAIAEVPTASGPVDYVLFVGLTAVAVVEAKRESVDVPGVLDQQAERYARDLAPGAVGVLGPWGAFRVPFAFATNGRAYLAQIPTKSGVWFRDLRADTNLARALAGWWTPEGIAEALGMDPAAAAARLDAEPFDDLGLYDYQVDVVRRVEAAIAAGQRRVLVAMATGTGKTRTALGFIYRALKSRRFRRVLFLVDRTSLGDQTLDAIGYMTVDGHQTIKTIYNVKSLGDIAPEGDTRLHVATIQALVRRVLYAEDPPPVDQYDLIVVDECHRGYSLDREMSDQELTFRSEDDYVSKYRRVLDWFDAVKVGLTATPALHTTDIFGRPVATYSYRQAVIEGRLIDHEPPLCIGTELGENGVHWKKADTVKVLHTRTGQLDLVTAPDALDHDIDDFNTRVLVPSFNDVVCTELANHLDPEAPGKTLIFCVRDDHADLVVHTLRAKLAERWGPIPNDLVRKITGRVDDPALAIRLFKNESRPKIVVTVDLLTTGIDVPAINSLVFLRRVRSRILYEQMLGRATRRCDAIGKEVFRIYDCVDLYAALEDHSTMRPVVTAGGSFKSLIEDMHALKDDLLREEVREQILARWQRKRRRLDPQTIAEFEVAIGVTAAALADHVKGLPVAGAAGWLSDHLDAFVALDKAGPPSDPTVRISDEQDKHTGTTRGYGTGAKPEDFLDSFRHYLVTHQNEIPALKVVLQRPRDLTRRDLRELALSLDRAGYGERALRTAWHELRNEDIGATIIGHIRRAALGSPLIPYAQRVEHAHEHILVSGDWTKGQRRWLRAFANQLKVETVLDREALDREPFKDDGGYARLNREFGGHVDDVIGQLTEALWADTG